MIVLYIPKHGEQSFRPILIQGVMVAPLTLLVSEHFRSYLPQNNSP